MIALIFTLALQSCENFAHELQNDGTELAAYHDICALAIDADIPGAYQVSTCVRESDGTVICNWYTYGNRRLPFEPRRWH